MEVVAFLPWPVAKKSFFDLVNPN
ncbi:hypothetical protein CCACVL1_08113 [Corchorus capsularis]|uniref:Uncharacterized protein n=1 Tax=Corchorus capsularis TaxID=210143 RepID=A0A1R3J2A9_COCAP|nr:hypothetical protein CCACVL1_08113 [Corchorus capsularis]